MGNQEELEYADVDEALWSELRVLLDWQESFTLVLLYSDDSGALNAVRKRLADVLRLKTRKLEVVAPQNPGDVIPEVMTAIQSGRHPPEHRPPLWISLDKGPENTSWNDARDNVLARLNEQRARLERDIPTLLVLALPSAFRGKMAHIAPDLWSVRTLSRTVPPRTFGRAHLQRESQIPAKTSNETGEPTDQEHFLWQRWIRWNSSAGSGSLAPAFIGDLVRLLLKRGANERAREVAETSLARIRVAADGGGLESTNKALAITALDAAGDARQANDLSENALNAYWESIALRRQWMEETGETPAALRDLGVALNKVGDVEAELGQWEKAGEHYRESLALRRRLVETLGETPQALRDLGVALNNVGNVEAELGQWEKAGVHYRESLALSRRLVESLGETPQALRDLSVALNNVGNVEAKLGQWEKAGEHYRESLALSRRLVESLGETPQALRDLSIDLEKVGTVEAELGQWEKAGEHYRESLALSRRLVESLGETPPALRDLGVALNNVGDVEAKLGQWEKAGEHYRESLALSRRLVESLGETPPALRDLGVALNKVGNVELELGYWKAADDAYRESLGLRRRLIEVIGPSPKTLFDVARSYQRLGLLAQKQQKGSSEVAALGKGIETATEALRLAPDSVRTRQLLKSMEDRITQITVS